MKICHLASGQNILLWLFATLVVTSSFKIIRGPNKREATYYFGGPILTMQNEQGPTYVEAVGIVDNVIDWVGTLRAAKLRSGPNNKWVDLQGHTLMPAFIDSHSHLGTVGFTTTIGNLYPKPDGQTDSIKALTQVMINWMIQNESFIKKSGWVMGFGYDDANLLETRHPEKEDLDSVSTQLPVIVIHQSLHIGCINSVGLALLNITSATLDPAGGRYRRKPNSTEPTGVIEQNAFFTILKDIMKQFTPTLRKELIGQAQKLYAANGFTTVQDGRTEPILIDYFIQLAELRQLTLDVCAYPDYFDSKVRQQQNKLKGIEYDGIGDPTWSPYTGNDYRNNFRVAGLKLALDGSIQGKTGWLHEPYLKPPENEPSDYSGYPILDQGELNQAVKQILSKKGQLIAHVNGDAAISQFLSAIQASNSTSVPNPAFTNLDNRRIVSIHSQMASQEHLDQMIKNKIIPSFFGEHAFYWGDWHASETLGEGRASKISPAKTALDKGMVFTQHTDAPVVMPNPLMMIWAVVNRVTRSGMVLGSDQRIDVYTALKTITKWAAYQLFQEESKGSIKPGNNADFVILSHDPMKVDPMLLKDIKVLETIKGGVTVYKLDSTQLQIN